MDASYNTGLFDKLDEAHKLRFNDPQKALDIANYVYIQSLKAADERLEAKSLYEMGICFELAASYPKAMKCLTESIKISNALGDMNVMADSLVCVGIIHDKLNNYSNALKIYLRALRLYETLNNKRKRAIVLSNIGLIYTNIKDYKSALKFYSQALELAEDEIDNESLLVTNINIGLTHQRLGNFTDASKFLEDAIKLADSVNDKHRKSIALDVIGEIQTTQNEFSKAYETLSTSLEIKRDLNDKRGIAKIHSFLGQLYLAENRLEDAKFSLLESLIIAEEIGLKQLTYETHKFLAEIYERQQNTVKALDHIKNAYQKELEYLKEESELKAKNIATQIEIEQAQKEAERERLKNVELGKALNEVKQLNVALKELNDEKNEFMAIAVHDLKNPLQNILSTARMIKKPDSLSKEQIAEFTDNIINQTDRMFGLIKKLLDHNAIEQGNIQLRNSLFSVDALCEELITNFKQQANKKEINLIFENNSLDSAVNTDKIILYEILQNLLSNAIKFSYPGKNVNLKTFVQNSDISIEITDEGPGFSAKDKEKMFSKFARLSAKPTADEHSTGLGLSIVKRLTDFIKAKLEFESTPGKGTRFTLKVPLTGTK
ncbi:MAG TPA: tetratricopeptide repeat-containing sensor histidine kinase [Ignavibacteria bacterium]|jgi:signal transduction histidine kinase/predicted negative regulator of RcsB-dependent stress response